MSMPLEFDTLAANVVIWLVAIGLLRLAANFGIGLRRIVLAIACCFVVGGVWVAFQTAASPGFRPTQGRFAIYSPAARESAKPGNVRLPERALPETSTPDGAVPGTPLPGPPGAIPGVPGVAPGIPGAAPDAIPGSDPADVHEYDEPVGLPGDPALNGRLVRPSPPDLLEVPIPNEAAQAPLPGAYPAPDSREPTAPIEPEPSSDDADPEPIVSAKDNATVQTPDVFDPNKIHFITADREQFIWPGELGFTPMRLTRLNHGGENWHDGMDDNTRADRNLLEAFERKTTFIADMQPHHHAIVKLVDYDRSNTPPIVFMTGTGSIPIQRADYAAIRTYIDNGGTLLADCGSPRFGISFRTFCKQLYPDSPLRPILADDPICIRPFDLQNDFDPLAAHDGKLMLGIKQHGRWAVIYHPGDLNNAWKTGHPKLTDEQAEQAFKLSINLIYHGYVHYLDALRKYNLEHR